MEQSAPIALNELDGKTLDPAVAISLPDNLSRDQFYSLLPCLSSKTSAPALGFPALQNWLKGLLNNLRLQHDEHHPYHKHPYRLREINIQAVDWFSSTKIGFMKLRAKIETDPYIHDGEKEARSDWLPGAVFLRGGSVAMLVSPNSLLDTSSKTNQLQRLSSNQKTQKAKTTNTSYLPSSPASQPAPSPSPRFPPECSTATRSKALPQLNCKKNHTSSSRKMS